MFPHRSLYAQQVHNRRMSALAVAGFVLFNGAMGCSFDLWTGSLYHDMASVPRYFLPLLAACAAYALWSFIHTLSARLWYRSVDDLSIEEQQRRNDLRFFVWLAFVVAGLIYLFFVYIEWLSQRRSSLFSDVFIGSTFPWVTILFSVAGGSYAAVAHMHASAMLLGSVERREPNEFVPEEQALLHVVDEMRIASGLPHPDCVIVEENTPNAWAVGTDPSQSTIVVTTSLLAKLSRDELQAVVAHEMSHIRNLDARMMTLVTALFGSALLLAGWSRTGGALTRVGLKRSKGRFGPLGIVAGLVAGILGPLVAQLLALSVSRQREYLADAGAAELTRNPGALADALRKLAAQNTFPMRTFRSVAHLCIVDPLARKTRERTGLLADWFSTHPPIGRRITLLNAMAYRDPQGEKKEEGPAMETM